MLLSERLTVLLEKPWLITAGQFILVKGYPVSWTLVSFGPYALIQSTNIASRISLRHSISISLSWYGFAFYIPRRCYRNLDNAENYRSTAWLYNILTSEEFRNAERMSVRTGSQVVRFCVFPFFPFHRNSVTLTLTTEFFFILEKVRF